MPIFEYRAHLPRQGLQPTRPFIRYHIARRSIDVVQVFTPADIRFFSSTGGTYTSPRRHTCHRRYHTRSRAGAPVMSMERISPSPATTWAVTALSLFPADGFRQQANSKRMRRRNRNYPAISLRCDSTPTPPSRAGQFNNIFIYFCSPEGF